MELPELLPEMTFEEASRLVVRFLKDTVPLGSWSVTRHAGDRQVHLTVQDDAWGVRDGDSHAWEDSLCCRMAAGAPQIAPDTHEDDAHRAAPLTAARGIRAYVGVPIRGTDGQMFGTLCGTDPRPQPVALAENAPVLLLLATLLGQILQGDELRAAAGEREAELHRRAFHDHLTALPNRAMFLDRLERALHLHRRDGRRLGVVLIDVDDFKGVNDTYGHGAGDDLLRVFGTRMGDALRPGDTLARIGGDEFAVLVEDGGDAVALAERALRALAPPFTLAGACVRVAATAGVAAVAADAPTPDVDTVLARADTALYAAKRAGKGRVVLHDPSMVLPEVQDLLLREPLRLALERGELAVHWQPVVDLWSGCATGFEALARWDHAGQRVAPDVFVPVAARGGLLAGLTDLVLDRACEQVAAWSAALGHRRTRVGVNVPPALIADRSFPTTVAAALARHGVEAHQLVLEITEDALLSDLAAARTTCRALSEQGVSLSLDDFGTGYSSLVHLREIPLDSLKIDRGFTRDLDTDPATERFLAALVGMSRDLGLNVVVEGVERRAQADVVRRLGARFAQGYHFARPGPAASVHDHLDTAGGRPSTEPALGPRTT